MRSSLTKCAAGRFAFGIKYVFAALGMALIFGSGATASAQISINDVLTRTTRAIQREEQMENQILFVQIDNVAKDRTSTQTYTLPADATFRVYAIGDDDRIADIDLEVLDASGTVIGKDEDDQNVAIVALRSGTAARRVSIKVNPYAMKGGVNDGFFSILIVRIDN